MAVSTRSHGTDIKEDPRIDFSFLLGEVTRLLRGAFDHEMETIGLTRSQWHVLVYVLKMDAPSQTALAEALDIARPSVGALIDQLENSGYVSRERDAHDRRVWRIVPTQLASQRAEAFAQSAERVATQVFASIEDRDLSAAMALLSTLRENLISPTPDRLEKDGNC